MPEEKQVQQQQPMMYAPQIPMQPGPVPPPAAPPAALVQSADSFNHHI